MHIWQSGIAYGTSKNLTFQGKFLSQKQFANLTWTDILISDII